VSGAPWWSGNGGRSQPRGARDGGLEGDFRGRTGSGCRSEALTVRNRLELVAGMNRISTGAKLGVAAAWEEGMRAGGREGGPEVRREGDGETLPLGKDAERKVGMPSEMDGGGRNRGCRIAGLWIFFSELSQFTRAVGVALNSTYHRCLWLIENCLRRFGSQTAGVFCVQRASKRGRCVEPT
jgi:hypothetical protein